MTNQHPLTDDFCDQIADCGEKDNMRSAADWQLEQVMKWLNKNIGDYTDDDFPNCDLEPFYLLESHLKEAMRPTTTQENN